MRVENISKDLLGTTIALSLLLMLSQAIAEGASARAAKDASEHGKAVATAARYLQGPGFIEPMLAAENVNGNLVDVEVDHTGWARMDKGQKMDFIDRVNGAALTASGGISIEVQISMNGSKVGASTFSGGQQIIRLVE